MVHNGSAKKTLPGVARVETLAASFLRARGEKQLADSPVQRQAIGDSARCRGEALPLPPSRCPAGTGRWCGNERRGGLVGLSPAALCGEAPKGHPKIRSESLEAVCVEAPKGHPRIHGCRRQHSARPSGKPKGRRAQSVTPLSRLTRMGERRVVDRSRDNPHGEPAASGKT